MGGNQNTMRRSAAVTVLQAARLLDIGKEEGTFTEAELSVATWKLDNQRFGLKGFEDIYPDHKRVVVEFMGVSKGSSPIVRGFMLRVAPCTYQMTSLGRSVAAAINSWEESKDRLVRMRSYTNETGFKQWKNDPSKPEHRLSVFAGYVETIHYIKQEAKESLLWCTARKLEYLAHFEFSTGLHVNDIVSLLDYITAMELRFPPLNNGKPNDSPAKSNDTNGHPKRTVRRTRAD